MKIGCFIVIILFFGFYSCNQKPNKKTAIEFNYRAMTLVSSLNNDDSCKKAITFLDSATAIDSNYFLGHFNKLMFLDQLKQYKKSIAAINNLIRLKPQAHDLYLIGGTQYEKDNDTLTAKIYFQKSLAICKRVLDTMNVTNQDYIMFSGNKKFLDSLLNK